MKYFQKIKTWGKENWPIWLLLLISLGVYRAWLSFEIFEHEDYRFRFAESAVDFLHYSAWNSQISLGTSDITIWGLLLRFFSGLFGIFALDSNVADKFLIFWPFAFLTPIFSYLFANLVLKNKAGAFVSALVFSFNTYYLAINTQGHLGLTLAGTFAPLAMFFFWRYFETKRKKNLIASALICLASGSYDFRVFYLLFFILLALPFWFLFLQKGREKRKIFFRTHFSAMALFFGLIFLFNLFWLLPTIATGSLANNEATKRSLVGNNFSLDLSVAINLFHPFWNGGEPKWFDDQKIPFYFWLIPIMATLGAYWNRKNKKILFWFFVALFGVFLSKQDALPLKSAYIWLHQNFPGFNAFREASKFYFVTALSYAILIGAFIKSIFERQSNLRCVKYGILFLTSLIFLWNAKPILNGTMRSIFVPQKITADELKIRDYVSSQNGSFRTLWNPTDSPWVSFSAYRPKVNMIETRRNIWKSIKDYPDVQGGEPDGVEKNVLFFSESFASRLFSQSAVRYLIFEQANLFMVKNLVANPEWKKLDLGLNSKMIFENSKVRPRVYLTRKAETIHREIAFEEVTFSMQNSARWNFEVKNSTEPVWINFSEQFHPDWKLACGNFAWHDAFRSENFFSDNKHFATDAKLNTFLLDTAEAQKKCFAGEDGKMSLSLYYRPQSYLYLGGIVSLGAVLVSIFMLIFWKEKKREKSIV